MAHRSETMDHTKCCVVRSTCSLRRTLSRVHVTCSMGLAACYVIHRTGSMVHTLVLWFKERVSCSVDHKTCSMIHSTFPMLHNTCFINNTTCLTSRDHCKLQQLGAGCMCHNSRLCVSYKTAADLYLATDVLRRSF